MYPSDVPGKVFQWSVNYLILKWKTLILKSVIQVHSYIY